MKPLQLLIVTPVFNDWVSFATLIKEVDDCIQNENIKISVLAVDDGSTSGSTINNKSFNHLKLINEIEILHLNCNLGHQRAIAIGLADSVENKAFDAVVVMDSDGEDQPEHINLLLEQFRNNPDCIVVARRNKRTEGTGFRIGYYIYKLLFRLLTGVSITFGNFCLIPNASLKRLVYLDSLWNHLAATILRSRLPFTMIATNRGTRYADNPSMNINSLILLGLGAIAVYIDIVLLRILLISIILGLMTIVSIGIVTIIRFFTELAIPGWASDVVGSLSIIFIQFLIVSIFVLFIILANRSQRTFIPAKHYSDFIFKREIIFQRE